MVSWTELRRTKMLPGGSAHLATATCRETSSWCRVTSNPPLPCCSPCSCSAGLAWPAPGAYYCWFPANFYLWWSLSLSCLGINESSPPPALPPQLPGFPLSLNVFLGLGSHLLTSDSGFKFLTNLQTLFYFYINASCSSQSWYKNKINK